jgi:hypothetical protein
MEFQLNPRKQARKLTASEDWPSLKSGGLGLKSGSLIHSINVTEHLICIRHFFPLGNIREQQISRPMT